ncbi:hypothetical protein BDR22DRAFT_892459 [Usnea florida]
MTSADFPNEILLNIISYVNRHSDLAKLTLVSHRFNELAEPYLYRKIHFHAEAGETGSTLTLKRTGQLEANLYARPELGAYTTALSFHVVNYFWYQDRPDLSLIRYMPRLRQLSYDPPPFQPGRLIANHKELTALRFDFSDYFDSCLEFSSPLHIIAKELSCGSHFSKLRKIQAEKFDYMNDSYPVHSPVGEQMLFRYSPVEDLRFLDCCPWIHGDVLGRFIHAVRYLKCFVLEINSSWDYFIGRNTSAPEVVIIDELERQRGTVEELAISTTEQELDLYRHTSGPLIKWTALKRLAIPESMLSETPLFQVNLDENKLHQVLPPQLEELQLDKKCSAFSTAGLQRDLVIKKEDLRTLEELATNKNACVPGLRRVIWWLQHPSSENLSYHTISPLVPHVQLDALEYVFSEVDVRFEWVLTALFKNTPVGKRLYEW